MPKYQEERERYGKKAKHKPDKKSNHKHEYKRSVVKYIDRKFPNGEWWSVGGVCSICGKIGPDHKLWFGLSDIESREAQKLPSYKCSSGLYGKSVDLRYKQ